MHMYYYAQEKTLYSGFRLSRKQCPPYYQLGIAAVSGYFKTPWSVSIRDDIDLPP